MFVLAVVLPIVRLADSEASSEALMAVGFKAFTWAIKRPIIGFMCDFLATRVFCLSMWHYLIRGPLDVTSVSCDYAWGGVEGEGHNGLIKRLPHPPLHNRRVTLRMT